MKHVELFILVILIAILSSCELKHTNHKTILNAEKMLNVNPDSAYKLLKNIQRPEKLSKADYAAWCLHFTHAQYKLYYEIKSDSLINIAVNFYSNSKFHKYSGTSYYLLGCISELLNRNDKAMLAYKKAVFEIEKSKNIDYNVLGLTIFNMGYIYRNEKIYYEAKHSFHKSLELFKASKNKRYQINSCLEISNVNVQLDLEFDSIMYYLNEASQLAIELKDSILYDNIVSRQGEFLYDINNKEAISKLLYGMKKNPTLEARNSTFLAYIYSELNLPDSALYYLKAAKKYYGTTETNMLMDLSEAAVNENQMNYKQAFNSMKKAYYEQDTIFQNKLKSQLYQIDKQFDLTEKEKENVKLVVKNRTKIIWIGVLIIIVLTTSVIYQRLNILNKKKQAILKLEQQQLMFELKEKDLENAKKQELLMSKLHQRIDITLHFNKLQQGNYSPQKHKDFLDDMTKKVVLMESEWQYYIEEANGLFNNKIIELQKNNKQLTAADMIVIALTCLGINIADSCTLLNSSKETMYMRRKRLKKRLGIEMDLEDWVKLNITNL